MLFLLFQLGKDRYALDGRQIEGVLPLVSIKQIPQAPPGVAGLFNYRGAPVPVIDLSELTLGRPAQRRLNTHIIIVHYPTEAGGKRLLGLIAEKATETTQREPTDFTACSVTNGAAPYLGPVASDERGLIQRY
jgi:chemotaxis-related protein WspB